ncbi:MAG: DUF3253 domain-containing protein [Pseudomonadota bacterium]
MAVPSAHTQSIISTILALTTARAPKSICPSEVARHLAADEKGWRALMPAVRAAAATLAMSGEISVTQRGSPVDAMTAKGPIRLARGRSGPQ